MQLSLVIPVYNEEGSLEQLHREICDVVATNNFDVQIIMIDDGSTDSSWKKITTLSQQDSRVQGIRFRRNFAKAAALTAGFDAATGDTIITIDADLQDDPAEIPAMLAKLDEGFDVVSGWKQIRNDPLDKTLPSKVFNWLVSTTTGVKLNDHNCGFKAYRREVVHEVRIYGELHRFIPVLAAARGFRIAEVPVNHRARQHGVSKYGWTRIIKGFLDLLTVKFITGFSFRPQHLLGTAGLISTFLGGLMLFYLAAIWCLSRIFYFWDPVHLHETAALYYSLGLFIMGTQFISAGFLGEMLTLFVAKDSDTYSIRETTT